MHLKTGLGKFLTLQEADINDEHAEFVDDKDNNTPNKENIYDDKNETSQDDSEQPVDEPPVDEPPLDLPLPTPPDDPADIIPDALNQKITVPLE